MTESDVLKLSRTNNGLANAIKSFPSVSLMLADGTTYNHEGVVVKTSGIIDATTGTVSVIARFPNPEHLLKSGGSGQTCYRQRITTVLCWYHRKLLYRFKIRSLYIRLMVIVGTLYRDNC